MECVQIQDRINDHAAAITQCNPSNFCGHIFCFYRMQEGGDWFAGGYPASACGPSEKLNDLREGATRTNIFLLH